MAKRLLETLEARVFLSSDIGNVVDVVWRGQHVQAIANQYLAQTQNPSAFFALAERAGFTGVKSLGGNGFYEFDSTLTTQHVAAVAASHPAAIAAVQPNFVVKAADTFPSDPYAVEQWHLRNTGQVEAADYNLDGVVTPNATHPSPPYPNEFQVGLPGVDDNMIKAWDVSTGSPNVVVAVLDTGIDTTHPDLVGNLFANPGDNVADGVDNDNNGFVDDIHGWNFVSDNNDVTDDNGHGTHVSGIIGAVGGNSIGVSGVNWSVKLLPIKVLDANGIGTNAAIIAGINYVMTLKAEGVNIVAMNESLGGPAFPFDILGSNVIREAGKAGILDVVAAGNDGLSLDANPQVPGSLSASLSNVITVAAIDNKGALAAFSNFGASTVDIAAPGVHILSTAPSYFVATNPIDPLDPVNPTGIPYGFLSGTSQATPQITGIIALEAAVRPNATAAQYKKALLDSAVFDSQLAGQNGLPDKVRFPGYANAFNAVRNIDNQFVKSDTTRMGNWRNFYGSQGAYVVGESTTFPAFVSATLNGSTPVILQDSTRNQVALQKISDANDRISAYGASATSQTIDLNFVDNALHRVTLYVADLDQRNRAESVEILDSANPSVVFDGQGVSHFAHGQYLTWDLSGDVKIKITNTAGPDCVFSGIFFDAPPANANAFAGQDSATHGFDWRNSYGSQGTWIVADNNTGTVPNYLSDFGVAFATAGSQASHTAVLRPTVNSPFVPQKNFDPYHGIASYWFDPDHIDISVTPNDTLQHQVTVYVADYGNRRRNERIQAVNSVTGVVLASQDVTNFSHGTFVSFNIRGSTIIRVTNTGGPDAVVSSVLFDAPPGEKLHFDGTDLTTMGNWKAAGYGVTRQYIAGESMPGVDGPNSPSLAAFNATRLVLRDPTNDARALLHVADSISSTRIAAYAFSNSGMSFNLAEDDHEQHLLGLYFVDYDNRRRSEVVTISDPVTGQILSRQRVSSFVHGKYLVYQIRGNVVITINSQSVPNAVISGIFLS